MNEGVFKRVNSKPIAIRIDKSELVPDCPGRARNAEESWIITICTKTVKTVTKNALIEISAKSAVLGIAQSKKINGEIATPKAITINLLI